MFNVIDYNDCPILGAESICKIEQHYNARYMGTFGRPTDNRLNRATTLRAFKSEFVCATFYQPHPDLSKDHKHYIGFYRSGIGPWMVVDMTDVVVDVEWVAYLKDDRFMPITHPTICYSYRDFAYYGGLHSCGVSGDYDRLVPFRYVNGTVQDLEMGVEVIDVRFIPDNVRTDRTRRNKSTKRARNRKSRSELDRSLETNQDYYRQTYEWLLS